MDNERVRRLEAERHDEEVRFNQLVATGDDFEASQSSLERLHELDGEIAEARKMSLTGEGTPRL